MMRDSRRRAAPACEPGDIIVTFNSTNVDELSQFVRLLSDAPVGTPVSLGVIRQGRQATVKVTVTQAAGRTTRRR